MFKGIILIGLLMLTVPAWAEDSYKDKEHVISLISGYDTIGGMATIPAGIKFDLSGLWHTYYRQVGVPIPGIGGVTIDFKGSKNVKKVTTLWPAPEYCNTFGLNVYGYKNTTVIPVKVELIDPSRDAVLNFKLKYQICDPGNCLKHERTLTKTIRASSQGPKSNDNLALIEGFEKKVPASDKGQGFTIESVSLDKSQKGKQFIIVEAKNPDGFDNPEVFLESKYKLYADTPKVTMSHDGHKATFLLPLYADEKKKTFPQEQLVGKTFTVTVKDGDKSVQGKKKVVVS